MEIQQNSVNCMEKNEHRDVLVVEKCHAKVSSHHVSSYSLSSVYYS